ncbi:MAG: hypothetical protein QOI04_865 [Verrucomicrobiota bacterium]|jgi:hypothetical protein
MNSTFRRKQPFNLAALAISILVAVFALADLRAQQPSPVTLPMKVDSDLSGISVELTSVQKTGDMLLIRFKYISTRETALDNIAREANQHVSDMYYVDSKNKKKYPIIKDTQGKPLSSNLQDFGVAAGETKGGWAKFPAPPAEVTTISVFLPGAPPFENVPIAQ